MPALFAVAIGLILGATAGGSFAYLKGAGLRFEGLLILAFLIQGLARGRLLHGLPSLGSGKLIWVLSSLVVVALLVVSIGRPGIYLVTLGTLMNVAVVLLNGAMPILHAGGSIGKALPGMEFYQLLNQSAIVPWAADAMVIRGWGDAYLASVGDILLLVGVVTYLVAAMSAGGGVSKVNTTGDFMRYVTSRLPE